MARSGIPSALDRRHLLERDLAPEQARATAEAYVEEGRLEEAVGFFAKAGADERLDAMAEEAVESGDVFLLTEISRLRGREPEPETWLRLADAARRCGKDVYAETADRQAHRGDD